MRFFLAPQRPEDVLGDLGLLALAIFVVPGFIADGVYRTFRGASLAEGDARTLLRSLTWSVIGFSLAWMALRNTGGLSSVAALFSSGGTPQVSPRVGEEMVVHGLMALSAAFIAANLPLGFGIPRLYEKVMRRSYLPGGAWGAFIREEGGKRRYVRVKTSSGKVYWGRMIAGDVTESRDLFLEDPSLDTGDGTGKSLAAITSARFLFVPSDEIHEVWLSRTAEEVPDA